MMFDKKECEAKLMQVHQLLRIASEIMTETLGNYNFAQAKADDVESIADRCKYISGQVLELGKTLR
jgi:hypothetical protein